MAVDASSMLLQNVLQVSGMRFVFEYSSRKAVIRFSSVRSSSQIAIFIAGGLSFLCMVKVYHETEWDSIAVHVEKNVIHVERLSLWLVHKILSGCYTLVKRGEVYYFDSRKDELHEAAAGI